MLGLFSQKRVLEIVLVLWQALHGTQTALVRLQSVLLAKFIQAQKNKAKMDMLNKEQNIKGILIRMGFGVKAIPPYDLECELF